MELMRDLFNHYMNAHSKRFKLSWKEDYYTIRRYLEPTLGNREIKSIKRIDIELLHGAIESKNSANRCVHLLSKIFNLAILWEITDKNPAKNVKTYQIKSREVFLPKEEANRFIATVLRYPKPYPDIILFLLATGCRKSEAFKLKWNSVDLDRGALTFKQTKNGTDHTIPLHPYVRKIIETQPKISDYVFVHQANRCTGNKYHGKPLKDIRHIWRKILADYGSSQHYMIKDLRRTLGSWLAQQGESLHKIGAQLNHKDPRATMVYSRFQLEHLKEPVEKALNDLDFSRRDH